MAIVRVNILILREFIDAQRGDKGEEVLAKNGVRQWFDGKIQRKPGISQEFRKFTHQGSLPKKDQPQFGISLALVGSDPIMRLGSQNKPA